MTELIIFAKAPIEGLCKQRLAKDIGDAKALAVHRELVERTLNQVAEASLAATLWVSEPHPDCEAWASRFGLELAYQKGRDLGERMADAIRARLNFTDQVILIGTDCPGYSPAYFEQAQARLAQADVVIGPAEDGGYALIGMKAPHPQLFTGPQWGSSSVYADTVTKAKEIGLLVEQCPLTWDVDTLADWQRYEAWRDSD